MAISPFPERRPTPHAEKTDAVGTAAQKPASEQLERILRSETFHKSDRLKRFLMFIVREAAAGRGAELKEYVIGVQVFRKEDSFDPRTDPIVRVQARRLRAKLVRYYREEGRADPSFEAVQVALAAPTNEVFSYLVILIYYGVNFVSFITAVTFLSLIYGGGRADDVAETFG